MSQTAIPLEFERYLQNQISAGHAPDMNEMIFAHIPGLDLSQPINRENGLPDVSLWVHQQDIDQVGKLGDNALAYSVVIPGTVAEFTFNAIYLRDKHVPNSCGMVVHKVEETKENGMASTKSLVQAYDGAAQIAGITVDASTWQIDYQARLKGIEEDHRLACLDNYGHTAFVDGFDVTQQAAPNKYKVTPGVVYVGGLRGVLAQEVIQTVATKPNGLHVDVVRQGTALSVWENKVTIVVSETELTDYVDGNGDQHYVAKLAAIDADGSVIDWRVKGGLAEHVADGDPHEQYLHESDYELDKRSQHVEFSLIPIYPELLDTGNKIRYEFSENKLKILGNQFIRFNGWNTLSLPSDAELNIDPLKVYHLRYSLVGGLRLLDLEDLAYNPKRLRQSAQDFDSTYQDALLAVVIKGEVTPLENKSKYFFQGVNLTRIHPEYFIDIPIVTNWSVTPNFVYPSINGWSESNRDTWQRVFTEVKRVTRESFLVRLSGAETNLFIKTNIENVITDTTNNYISITGGVNTSKSSAVLDQEISYTVLVGV